MSGPRPGRTPSAGVLFRFCHAGLLLLTLCATGAAAQSLESEDADRVVEVLDGRTLVFERLGPLQLIGIHVPALDSGEPLAGDARELVAQAALDRVVRVVTETRANDARGRMLGHVFLADGRNLQEQLLEQGLATVEAQPPNLFYLERFLAVESRARDSGEGVWGLRHYQPVAADRLGSRHAGYRFVRGRVSRVHGGERYVYLNLTDRFAAVVRTSDWVRYFPGAPADWMGREVIVRGIVGRYRHGMQIRIAHPAMLELAGARP